MDRTVDHRFAELAARIELEPDLAALHEADLAALVAEFGLSAEPVYAAGPLVIIEDLGGIDTTAMAAGTVFCRGGSPQPEPAPAPTPAPAPAAGLLPASVFA
jgi:hypothetical protein